VHGIIVETTDACRARLCRLGLEVQNLADHPAFPEEPAIEPLRRDGRLRGPPAVRRAGLVQPLQAGHALLRLLGRQAGVHHEIGAGVRRRQGQRAVVVRARGRIDLQAAFEVAEFRPLVGVLVGARAQERHARADAPERRVVLLPGRGVLHASNEVPPDLSDLGLPAEQFERHIAYDIGAAAVTRSLARRLRAPAILTRFSRLLIDPNRGRDDPTLVMRLSDGAVVPGNRRMTSEERERRLDRFYRPYHTAVARRIDAMLASGTPPAILSIHSYTPVWKGAQRPWHAGILWDKDPRFALPLLEKLRAEPGLRVGDNEPYLGALKNDTMYRHATARGLAHVLLEVRNDLIAAPAGVLEWADRLEPIVKEILAAKELHEIRHFGSLADEN